MFSRRALKNQPLLVVVELGGLLQESDDATSFVESAANGVSAALDVVDNAVAQGRPLAVGLVRILEVFWVLRLNVWNFSVWMNRFICVYIFWNIYSFGFIFKL